MTSYYEPPHSLEVQAGLMLPEDTELYVEEIRAYEGREYTIIAK